MHTQKREILEKMLKELGPGNKVPEEKVTRKLADKNGEDEDYVEETKGKTRAKPKGQTKVCFRLLCRHIQARTHTNTNHVTKEHHNVSLLN